MRIIIPLICFFVMAISFVSAVSVNPYQTLSLPQLNANRTAMNTSLHRTYLYCTWRIDGIGEEAVLMNSSLCPANPVTFTFEDSQKYSARIDYAKISYAQNTWVIEEIGKDGEMNVSYDMSIPEPPQSIFSAIFNNIIATVRSWLCRFFPGLSFCS